MCLKEAGWLTCILLEGEWWQAAKGSILGGTDHWWFDGPGKEDNTCDGGFPHDLLAPRCRGGLTIDFIGHHNARNLWPELPKLCIPGAEVLVRDFPLHVKYLNQQRKEDRPGASMSPHSPPPPGDTHTSKQARAWGLRPRPTPSRRPSDHKPHPHFWESRQNLQLVTQFTYFNQSIILLIVPLINLWTLKVFWFFS